MLLVFLAVALEHPTVALVVQAYLLALLVALLLTQEAEAVVRMCLLALAALALTVQVVVAQLIVEVVVKVQQ
jgi:hypothetical protein